LDGGVTGPCVTPTKTPPMLMSADREKLEVFASMVYVTLPDPVPEPLTVIQVTFDELVQVQPAAVVTVIVPLPPAPATFTSVGESVNEHVVLDSVTV
jgi:hypothetical protein